MVASLTSENANRSATSVVHWKSRVSKRVVFRTPTGTVVTLASCPANRSHKLMTCINYSRKLFSSDESTYMPSTCMVWPIKCNARSLEKQVTSWVVQARGPANVIAFLSAFSFRSAVKVRRATSCMQTDLSWKFTTTKILNLSLHNEEEQAMLTPVMEPDGWNCFYAPICLTYSQFYRLTMWMT